MNFIQELEAATQALLNNGVKELKELEEQQQRQTRIAEIAKDIRQKLEPLLKQVEDLMSQFAQKEVGNRLTVKQLEQQRDLLQEQIEQAESLAEIEIDEALLREEEKNLAKQEAAELRKWRVQLKQDLLELIEEQGDFYDATDLMIAVKGHLEDLKQIGALEEVVDRLIKQINRYDRKNSDSNNPTAKVRDSYESTVNFIAEIAHKNRQNANYVQRTEFTSKREKPTGQTVSYKGLSGKVVIIGGHDRLETAVRTRLRSSSVELIWATAQSGSAIWEQVETQVQSADLVIVMTGYSSHTITQHVLQNKGEKKPIYITTTGMTRLIEAIEVGLKSQRLSQQLGRPKSA
ncbi:DUF2325 domain-containing protein [Phormidesmis sp. 146-35]